MNHPRALRPGDTVALIAPSGCSRDPDLLPDAVAQWEGLGYRVKVGDSCAARHGYLAGTDELRAGDVNRFFADDSVSAILCIKGGYGAARILPRIDFAMIRRHPKIFAGYSDITALHSALNRWGNLITFHGPNAKMPGPREAWDASLTPLLRALTVPDAYEIQNPPGFSMTTLQGGKSEGVLTGGNLTLIAHSLGTPYCPDFSGRILFLEDIGEHTYRVDEMLVNLKQAGVFDQCAGILLGEFTDCTVEYPEYGLTLEEVFKEIGFPAGKPVLRGLRAGHCAPTLTLPMGALCELDADAQTLRLLESPTV